MKLEAFIAQEKCPILRANLEKLNARTSQLLAINEEVMFTDVKKILEEQIFDDPKVLSLNIYSGVSKTLFAKHQISLDAQSDIEMVLEVCALSYLGQYQQKYMKATFAKGDAYLEKLEKTATKLQTLLELDMEDNAFTLNLVHMHETSKKIIWRYCQPVKIPCLT